MSLQAHPSPNSAFSALDSVAGCATDLWLLIGRVLLCWVFLATAWGHVNGIGGFTNYLTSLNAPAPQLMAYIGTAAEVIIAVTLLFGVATRYGAAVAILFLIISTALAHRYWEYPAAQVMGQYNNFLKNLAILGGMIYVFVFGPGRFSVDRAIGNK